MLFFSSVFISSLFHFRDDFDKTENTKKPNERYFYVDDLEYERYQHHNRIKDINED